MQKKEVFRRSTRKLLKHFQRHFSQERRQKTKMLSIRVKGSKHFRINSFSLCVEMTKKRKSIVKNISLSMEHLLLLLKKSLRMSEEEKLSEKSLWKTFFFFLIRKHSWHVRWGSLVLEKIFNFVLLWLKSKHFCDLGPLPGIFWLPMKIGKII